MPDPTQAPTPPARARRGPRQLVRWFFSLWAPLSTVYWAVLDAAFSREHRAVLAGMRAFGEAGDDANRYALRRATHRIEKGLLMRPRRPVFGKGYIEDMVRAYEIGLADLHAGRGDQAELRWSHDVLREYFAVSGPDTLVDQLRPRFEALPPIDAPEGAPASSPYLRDLDGPRPVEYDAFYALAKRRRSVRWFKQEPVPRELIDRAIVAGAEAPSACNRQPFVFRVFDDPALVNEISQLPMGTTGFAHNFPAIVVLVGQLRAYAHPRDRHLIYIDGSLAAMGFMLALETLGLSSCPINWPDIPGRERAMAKRLALEPDQRPVMLIAVGYPDPDGAVAFSQKQSLDHLRTWNL